MKQLKRKIACAVAHQRLSQDCVFLVGSCSFSILSSVYANK